MGGSNVAEGNASIDGSVATEGEAKRKGSGTWWGRARWEGPFEGLCCLFFSCIQPVRRRGSRAQQLPSADLVLSVFRLWGGGMAWHPAHPHGGGGAAPWPRQALLLSGGSADVGRPLGRGVAPAVIDAADLAAGGVEGAAYHGGGLPHDLQQQQGSRQGGEGGVSARWQHGQSPAGSLLGHRRPQRPTAPSLADMQCSDWQAAGWQAVGPWKRYAGTLHPPYHSPTHPLTHPITHPPCPSGNPPPPPTHTHPITHPPGRSAARLR